MRWHPQVEVPTEPAPDLHASTHRSRIDLERILANPGDQAAWNELEHTYDEQSAIWTDWAREQPWYAAPVRAGMSYARTVPWMVEVGCGTGQATEVLSQVGPPVYATDVNLSMLKEAMPQRRAVYLAADVRNLPFKSWSVPLLVGLNGVPYIKEFDRVLAPAGQLLWCTSFGAGTPLYVKPERFVELLGPNWTAEGGLAGHGEWVLATRKS